MNNEKIIEPKIGLLISALMLFLLNIAGSTLWYFYYSNGGIYAFICYILVNIVLMISILIVAFSSRIKLLFIVFSYIMFYLYVIVFCFFILSGYEFVEKRYVDVSIILSMGYAIIFIGLSICLYYWLKYCSMLSDIDYLIDLNVINKENNSINFYGIHSKLRTGSSKYSVISQQEVIDKILNIKFLFILIIGFLFFASKYFSISYSFSIIVFFTIFMTFAVCSGFAFFICGLILSFRYKTRFNEDLILSSNLQ